MLATQRTADQDALNGLSHIQPRATQRSVERHHAMGAQPADQLGRLVASEVVPHEQDTQGRQVGREREGLCQGAVPTGLEKE
jgi:hypothetical protein